MPETLRDLTSEMKEINDEIQYLAALDIDTQQLEETMESLKKKVLRKVSSIDHIAMSFDIAKGQLQMLAQVHEQEAAIAKKKIELMEKNKDRIYQMLFDVGLVEANKPLKTEKHTYYVQNTFGEVVIADESQLPKEYMKTKIEQVIDKKKLREDIIAGKEVEGASVKKKMRVSRR